MGSHPETESEHQQPDSNHPISIPIVATAIAAVIINAIGGGLNSARMQTYFALAATITPWNSARDTLGELATGALGVLAAWALVRFIDHRGFRDLGLSVGWRRGLVGALTGMATTLVASVLAILIAYGLGFLPRTDLVWIYQNGTASQIISGLAYTVLASVFLGIGANTLWCGYLLRSISARPLVAVMAVTVVPSLLGFIPRSGQETYSMYLESQLSDLPAELGVNLAAVAFAIALRSVWAAVGITVGGSLVSYAAPLPGGGASTAGAAGVSALTGVLFIIAALIALRVMRRRWEQFAETGPFDV